MMLLCFFLLCLCVFSGPYGFRGMKVSKWWQKGGGGRGLSVEEVRMFLLVSVPHTFLSSVPLFGLCVKRACVNNWHNIRLGVHWVFWVSAFDKKDGPLTEEENDQYILVKEKMLGNIKFIGQLTVSCLVGGGGGGLHVLDIALLFQKFLMLKWFHCLCFFTAKVLMSKWFHCLSSTCNAC